MTKVYFRTFHDFQFRAAIDISKHSYAIFCVDQTTGEIFEENRSEKDFLEFFRMKSKSVIAMEACATSKYWARRLSELNHEVLLLPPKKCKPFVDGCKSDRNDARGIYRSMESVRPSPRPITLELQQIDTLVALRKFVVKEYVSYTNALRSHLAEYGKAMPKTIKGFENNASICINELEQEGLGAFLIQRLRDMLARYKDLRREEAEYSREINRLTKESRLGQLLRTISGVGAIVAACALPMLSDPKAFANGREFAAFLGLVPSHTGTGGRTINGKITKRGDRYLRAMLVQGAMAALRQKVKAPWLERLISREPARKKVAVALAARIARVMWAIANTNQPFELRML